MNLYPYFDWIDRHHKVLRVTSIPAVLILVFAVYALVYMTGGIKYVFSHSMYIPILIGGFIFGTRGGLLVGLLGGLVLGPYMPIDTVTGEMQKTINWIYRTGFFCLIGLVAGGASTVIQAYIKHMKWASQHDSFSGLPNRIALEETLRNLIPWDEEDQDSNYLFLFSIGNAKEIEIAFGAQAIEEVIAQLVKIISDLLSESFGIYRMGSTELCVLILQKDRQEILQLADSLSEMTKQPFTYRDLTMHGDVYIGVVKFEDIEEEPEFYLRKAESVISKASTEIFRKPVYADLSADVTTKDSVELLGKLNEGIKAGQLFLHYQPKVIIETGEVYGVEALVRWDHPSMGSVPPGRFIPRAENSTLIDDLTGFVVDQSLLQCRQWRDAGIDLKIAVNISTRNLIQHEFVEKILELLEKYGVTGDQLEFEITETSFMTNIEKAIVELNDLNDSNIIISIDDFGTGYSSLQYLQDLPISCLKIDQSFVKVLPDHNGASHIVGAAMDLAHRLNKRIIAEGVESKTAYDYLRDIGCDMAQGYYISRPTPSREFTSWYQDTGGYFQAT